MSKLQQAVTSIQLTIDSIVQYAEKLPKEIIYWKPDENAWSIIEILAHIEEATPYWLTELKQVVESPGIEWGRGLDHDGRLAAVAQAGQRSLEDVLAGIQVSKQKVKNVLLSLKDEDLTIESPSRNPRFGTKPMTFIVNHLLVEHLNQHLKQIQRNIQQYEDNKLSI
jgi:uncharacterized damage-inducible protein DinB